MIFVQFTPGTCTTKRDLLGNFLVLLLLFGLEVDHLVDLLGAVAEQALKIADEAVDVPLPGCLQYYVLVVVIPEAKKTKVRSEFRRFFCTSNFGLLLTDDFKRSKNTADVARLTHPRLIEILSFLT